MPENQKLSATPVIPTKVNLALGLTVMICMLAIASLNIMAAMIGLDRDTAMINQDVKLVKH